MRESKILFNDLFRYEDKSAACTPRYLKIRWDCGSAAFIENVVTHADYRGKGYATECLNYAKDIAIKQNCYKIMLLTGSKTNATLNFYGNAGYNSSDKTAFIQWLD